ncbi:MAG: hypothetical protein Q8P84_06635 [Deltaproteobacteria bacterium]|nr:hypothetical protein [Deltaproteobacteria bacterium]
MTVIFFATATIFVTLSLIALIDSRVRSFPKTLLFFFAGLSALYQIAFIFHLPFFFTAIDVVFILLVLFFWRRILVQFKQYFVRLFAIPSREGKWAVYLLYFFLAYLFFLSVFSVPGWDWDSMIFHLSRPFLYLNEKTVFTAHFSDARQTVWPMGGDILFYLFTRHGSTVGVGFISFLGYIGILLAIHNILDKIVSPQKALTLIFVAASFPTLVYSATTVKGDPLAVFAFVMLWIAFKNFHETRKRSDLVMFFLSLAFGLSVKLTFVFAAFFSLIGFAVIELLDRKPLKLQGPPVFSPIGLFFFGLLCLLLSQTHLYIFNLFQFHHPMGPTVMLISTMTWKTIFQNFFKYQLELIDFVLPLSSVGIPFIDTAFSWLYNHSIGALTHDTAWHFHYFPQEMNASFGPFGFFLILIGIYWSLFGKTTIFSRVFAWTCMAQILFIVFNYPREEAISIVRYFSPVFVASLFLLPKIFESPLLKWQKTIRFVSLSLLLFCSLANYAQPLIAYHPKAIPWYRYAFTNRDFLYKEKHFYDNRIDIYKRAVRPEDRILLLGGPNIWVYPYYQHAPSHRLRLKHFPSLPKEWVGDNLKNYDLVICEGRPCIEKLKITPQLQQIWKSAEDLPREAAFYRRIQ